MIFEPKQNNRVPDVTVLCLFACSAVAMGFGKVEGIPGNGLLQFLAIVFLCAMIFVVVKYKLTSFRYTVKLIPKKGKSLHHDDDEDEERALCYEQAEKLPVKSIPPEMLALWVERRQGKGSFVTECMIELSKIHACLYLPEEKELFDNIVKENKGIGKYKYFRNMSVSESCVIFADSPAGKILVFLETEEELFHYLRAVAAYNNENNTQKTS